MVSAALFLATSPSAYAQTPCLGAIATIVGTTGDDILAGSPGNDVIAGLGGDDVISGGLGDDVICGDEGNAG